MLSLIKRWLGINDLCSQILEVDERCDFHLKRIVEMEDKLDWEDLQEWKDGVDQWSDKYGGQIDDQARIFLAQSRQITRCQERLLALEDPGDVEFGLMGLTRYDSDDWVAGVLREREGGKYVKYKDVIDFLRQANLDTGDGDGEVQ